MNQFTTNPRTFAGFVMAMTMILTACGTEDPAATADAKLRAMSDVLAGAESFAVNADEEFVTADASTANRTMALSVRRPDGFRAEISGDTGTSTTVYDGETLTVAFSEQEVWAAMDAPDTIDATIDTLALEHQTFIFMGDLLAASPYDSLIVENMTGSWATAEIDGTKCDHLTYSNEFVEWQLWIRAEGEPLPVKFAIDYKGGEWPFTSFVATFDGWKLDHVPSSDTFSVAIPDSYEQIEFAMRSAQ